MVDPSWAEPCSDSATVNTGIPRRVFFIIYSWIARMFFRQFSPVNGNPSTKPQPISPTKAASLPLSSSCPLNIFQECICRICVAADPLLCLAQAVHSSYTEVVAPILAGTATKAAEVLIYPIICSWYVFFYYLGNCIAALFPLRHVDCHSLFSHSQGNTLQTGFHLRIRH